MFPLSLSSGWLLSPGKYLPNYRYHYPKSASFSPQHLSLTYSMFTSLSLDKPGIWGSLVAQLVKNPPATRETWVQSLGWEDPLEEGMATHCSILAWRITWTVRSMESQKVGHNKATFTFTAGIKAYWRKGLVYLDFQCLDSIKHTLLVLVVQSYPTLCDPMDCSPTRLPCSWDFPGKNTGVAAIAFSWRSSLSKDATHVSCIGRGILYCWATKEANIRGSINICWTNEWTIIINILFSELFILIM